MMPYCGKCGTWMEGAAKFCPNCGVSTAAPEEEAATPKARDTGKRSGTPDTTAEYTADEIKSGRMMSVLAYLSALILIPLFAAKDCRFARYHTNQGLALFMLELIVSVIARVLWRVLPYGFLWRTVNWICSLCALACFALAAVGILHALNGRAKELPLIGRIRILK